MIRRPPRSTRKESSAASDVYKRQVYKWFMEMFVDSSDWVMVPNVYGMGLFSDGGIFATKPYICGSSYFMKMMDFKKGEWLSLIHI